VNRSEQQINNPLIYTVRAVNSGNGVSTGLVVTLNNNPEQLRPGDILSINSGRGDRFDFASGNGVNFATFGTLNSGETREIRYEMVIRRPSPNNNIAPGDIIRVQGRYPCPQNALLICATNQVRTEVISSTPPRPPGTIVNMSVSPDRGPPGTNHRFSANEFIPNERYVTWLNFLDTGFVQELDIAGSADASGQIRFSFNSGGLPVGNYSIVATGRSSEIQGVGAFRVQGPGGLLSAGQRTIETRHGGFAVPPSNVAAEPRATPGAAPAPIPAGGISGKITAQDTGSGLADATVVVRDGDGNTVQTARTYADGTYFIFFGLPSGVYTVQFLTGLSTDTATRTYAGATISPVSVVEPQMTTGINAALVKGGAITGKVTAEDGGAGLPDVPVLIKTTAGLPVGLGTTDTEGAYSITGLATGSYNIELRPSQSVNDISSVYADPVGPSTVDVTAPNTATVNLTLSRSLQVGQITGRVVAEDTSQGLRGVFVSVFDASNSALASLVKTDANGFYASEDLAPGSYKVSFIAGMSPISGTRAYLNQAFSGNAVVIEAGQSKTANATLKRGATISGRVTAQDSGAGLENVAVISFNKTTGQIAAIGRTDAAGNYTTPGVIDGVYGIEFFTAFSSVPTTTSYVSTFFNNKPNLNRSDPITISGGAARTGVNQALVRGAGLGGTVTGADTGAGLPGVLTIIYDAAQNVRGVALTDPSGNYRINGLGSGSYIVQFDTLLSLNPATRAYFDRFFDSAEDQFDAEPVLVIAPNPRTDINQALPKGGEVSGRITAGDTKDGLAGVAVLVYDGSGRIVTLAVSDKDGFYITPALATGSYRLQFDPTYSASPVTAAYAKQFYNNKNSLAEATAVEVTLPNVTPNINAELVQIVR
jgi:hypothetical protein